MTFDTLWEQEELRGLQHRLRHEYPVWQRQRRQRHVAAGFVILLAVGLSIYMLQSTTGKPYDEVCCNRSGIADSHWAAVAGNILTLQSI